MLVVNVVGVSVLMFEQVVLMLVFVMLSNMDVNPNTHQRSGKHERHAERIAQ
jgi:hypothetical protein